LAITVAFTEDLSSSFLIIIGCWLSLKLLERDGLLFLPSI